MSVSFRFLSAALFWIAGHGIVRATPLVFSDDAVILRHENGIAMTEAQVKLGRFTDGFVPTASNRDQWADHWHSSGTGFYAASTGACEWSAECIVAENAGPRAGEPFYVWVLSSAANALFTDPHWQAPDTPPLGTVVHYAFTGQTTAIVGAIDPVRALASLAGSDLSMVAQPSSRVLAAGGSVTFTVEAIGVAPLTYQWRKNGIDIPGATAATFSLINVSVSQAGSYSVVVSNPTGSVVSQPAQLTLAAEPVIAASPMSRVAALGRSATFSVSATSALPMAYQWFKDGTPIPGATSATYTLGAVTAADAGTYTVAVSNAVGTVTGVGAVLTVDAAYLTNVSVRTGMKAGRTLILGFVVANGSKPVLVRAGGPVLDQYGLSGLSDPSLKLFDGSATVVATNDNWPDGLRELFATLGATPYEAGSKDAALVATLAGPHTVHVTGTSAGVVLAEAYDADPGNTPNGSKLVNVSARSQVGTGEDVLIGGFVIGGTGRKQVLIRGVGPGLVHKGVTDVLADPQITVFDRATPIAQNDDWSPDLAATFERLGAFALDAGSKDAALVIELDAGKPYTVHVSGTGQTTGEALVEVYDANP